MKKLTLLLLAGASLFGVMSLLTAQNNTPAAADPFVKSPGPPPPTGSPTGAGAGVDAGVNDERGWKNCVLVLEVYALDKNDGLSVLASERGSAARYRRVADLVKTGKARLEILTALTNKSGQRAVVEAVDEVRYATEFARPVAKGGIASPTAFEKRDVGDILEFEPVVTADGRSSDLQLVPQHVRLLGFRDIGATTGDSPVSYPHFTVQKLTSGTKFPLNEPHFLGSLTPATGHGVANGGAASELWLAFLRMQLVGPTADEMKPPAKPMDWSALNLEYSIYSLERAAAREILVAAPDLQAPWKSLQALLAEKKARFEHLVSVQSKSGQRAVTEESQGVPYAGEYASAARPTYEEKTSRTSSTRPGGPVIDGAQPSDRDKTTTTTGTVNRVIANAEVTPGMPATLQNYDTGVNVEVEPVVGPDGLSIDVQHMVKSVTHLGDLKTTGLAVRYPAQPLFERRQFTTSQTLLAGRHMLIGTFNPPGANGVNDRADSGRTWLVFVRATPNEP